MNVSIEFESKREAADFFLEMERRFYLKRQRVVMAPDMHSPEDCADWSPVCDHDITCDWLCDCTECH